jgi:hypothetical protein
MSRCLVVMFVGATIAVAVSTSASAYHCLAREGHMVGLLLARGIATLLAIILSAGHALNLRDRRRRQDRTSST